MPLPNEPPLCFPEDHEIYATVDQMLNDFDFVALGVFKGVYDEDMFWSAVANDFVDLYKTARRYIKHTQAAKRDPEIWSDFSKLSVKWGGDRAPSPRPRQVGRAWKLALKVTLDYVVAGSGGWIRRWTTGNLHARIVRRPHRLPRRAVVG